MNSSKALESYDCVRLSGLRTRVRQGANSIAFEPDDENAEDDKCGFFHPLVILQQHILSLSLSMCNRIDIETRNLVELQGHGHE